MSESPVAKILVARGLRLFRARRKVVAFTGDPSADALLNDIERYPHLFVLGCVMDRQINSERAWLIPIRIAEQIGSPSFRAFSELPLSKVRRLMVRPEPLHRFHQKMSGYFHQAVQHITATYKGDASGIWNDGPSSAEIVWRFLAFPGVGPKIATMATNILARHFKVHLADHYSVDISVDIHVRRVFERLKLIDRGATQDQIVYRARALHPRFPGLLDFPVWEIGRNWCRPLHPKCPDCPLAGACSHAASAG
jgi:endonuclease III